MPQCLLRQVMVIQPHKSMQGFLQVFAAVEVVRAQHLAQPSIEALDHAIGLRSFGLGQPMLNTQGLAQLVKLVLSCGLAASATKQAVSELFAVVREDGVNLECGCLAHRCQE